MNEQVAHNTKAMCELQEHASRKEEVDAAATSHGRIT